MAYEPTTWKSGDVVTSAKLNKLENGVAAAGGMFVMHKKIGTETLDANYNQVSAALEAGKPPVIYEENAGGGVDLKYVLYTWADDTGYGIATGETNYLAESATDPLIAGELPG